jgi:hypothetical protein
VLIRHLPGDSRLAKLEQARRRAAGIVSKSNIEDADPAVWTQTEWMLVHLLDQLQLLNFAYRQAHSKTRLPMPKFMPRPGSEPLRRKTVNAWFGAVGLPPLETPVRKH